jgi:hypothetical protein
MKKKLAKAEDGKAVKPKSTTDMVKAGINAGFKVDQKSAFKAGLDTNSVINMSKKGEPGFAGVKKNIKKTGGAIKTKKK